MDEMSTIESGSIEAGAIEVEAKNALSKFLSSISHPGVQDLRDALREWIREQGLWWASSITAHALVLSIVMLVAGAIYVAPKIEGEAPRFDSADVDTTVPEVENFQVGDTPIDPTELNTQTLSLEAPTVTEQINTTPDDPFSEAGGGQATPNATTIPGLGGLDLKAIGAGPALKGPGGIGGGNGEGKGTGIGSGGSGFGARGTGVRKAMLGSGGGTKQSERAVAAALNWLARHQNADGSWSLTDFTGKCKDQTCTGPADVRSDSAATALALLPFLAAGQTHQTKGPYQKNIQAGLYWLTSHQKNDGEFLGNHHNYSHGLAAITVCEAYGLSHDKSIGHSAQLAIHYIEKIQNPQTGSWRYRPLDEGDTSVFGWMVMALKSAQMSGLSVSSQTMAGDQRWLKSVGNGQGQFAYMPGDRGSPAMCAVGLLCTQYLGAPRQDPQISGGMAFLMGRMPELERRDIYYWYYATQVMHNLPGYEWDTWNRKMRKILIETQVTKGCAAGSWDPELPTPDRNGTKGGRIMMTSLSALTLEVYYRYLPLYQLDGAQKGK
jgi:hypothetical protein